MTAGTVAPLLELDHVSRVYGEHVQVHALRDVSLQIHAGDHMAIIGPSGSGKSTMLGLLGVLDKPSEGRVFVAGQDSGALDDDARSRLRGDTIGFVFQQFHLIPHLTAFGNVDTALLYRGLTRAQRRERAMAALEEVGLGLRADHRPVQMSGGEQQRVAIARAIVTEPLLVLADEPTGALDRATGAEVMRLLTDATRAAGASLVVVTHDVEVASWCTGRIEMRDGRIVDPRAAADLPTRPVPRTEGVR